MGCVGSALSEDQKQAIQESTKLDDVIRRQQHSEGKVIKLLLLGTGESGKSTIFKQMQILYQEEGFTESDKMAFQLVIRRNVVEAMQTLIYGAERFRVTFALGKSEVAVKFMLDLDPLVPGFWSAPIVDHVLLLWTEETALRKLYDNAEQRSKMQLLDATAYLFEHIRRIGKSDYIPTSEDILRARLRTSGIVERTFRIQGLDFKFLDVGGQRNERRKWIHCFDGVTAMIFVTAISEYDQVLYEDEKKNRLDESIEVFENVCNNRFFEKTTMILFLNKVDLFEDKLKRVPLSRCLPDYTGDNSLKDAAKFIETRFTRVNTSPSKVIYPHLTCATDTTNVEKVFEACKQAILKGNVDEMKIE